MRVCICVPFNIVTFKIHAVGRELYRKLFTLIHMVRCEVENHNNSNGVLNSRKVFAIVLVAGGDVVSLLILSPSVPNVL